MNTETVPNGLRILFVWAGLLLAGCATSSLGKHHPPSRYEFERPQMGLPFRLVLYATTPALATNAAEAAWSRIAELNAILSDYEPESELSRLSRTGGSGRWIPLGRDLSRVLIAANMLSRDSNGAFDVTVGPEVALWKRARRQRELPSKTAIAEARRLSGWTLVELRRRSGMHEALVARSGMRLDLGAIAKGYALDEAALVLRQAGIRRFLLAGGGDMVMGDPPPGQTGWRVEAGVFDTPEAPTRRLLHLANTALATSGDSFQRAEMGGVRYSHIVDPRTGIGMTDHSLVTVICPSAMLADALSTAVSVLGPTGGPDFAAHHGAEVWILRKPSSKVEETQSAGFPREQTPSPHEGR